MAVDRATPARSKFRMAVRRKSCGIRPARPARAQAVSQARRKLLIGCPFVGIVYFEYGGRCLDH